LRFEVWGVGGCCGHGGGSCQSENARSQEKRTRRDEKRKVRQIQEEMGLGFRL
jgi:hypothetical protein